MVKNLPAYARDPKDTGLTPGWERSPGGENDNPLQYSCPENPRDRGAWWATGYRVAELDTTEVTEHAHTWMNKLKQTLLAFVVHKLRIRKLQAFVPVSKRGPTVNPRSICPMSQMALPT